MTDGLRNGGRRDVRDTPIRLARAAGAAALLIVLVTAGVLAAGLVYDEDAHAATRPLLKTLWVVVNEDGTLDRAKGVRDTDRLAAGTYRITFNRNVSGCAYSATIDLSGVGEGHAGEVYVDQTLDDPSDPPSPRQVDVITFNSSGTSSSDNQFDLIVHC
jgi:hypothetical protein